MTDREPRSGKLRGGGGGKLASRAAEKLRRVGPSWRVVGTVGDDSHFRAATPEPPPPPPPPPPGCGGGWGVFSHRRGRVGHDRAVSTAAGKIAELGQLITITKVRKSRSALSLCTFLKFQPDHRGPIQSPDYSSPAQTLRAILSALLTSSIPVSA